MIRRWVTGLIFALGLLSCAPVLRASCDAAGGLVVSSMGSEITHILQRVCYAIADRVAN